jgi:hypothetical protein
VRLPLSARDCLAVGFILANFIPFVGAVRGGTCHAIPIFFERDEEMMWRRFVLARSGVAGMLVGTATRPGAFSLVTATQAAPGRDRAFASVGVLAFAGPDHRRHSGRGRRKGLSRQSQRRGKYEYLAYLDEWSQGELDGPMDNGQTLADLSLVVERCDTLPKSLRADILVLIARASGNKRA